MKTERVLALADFIEGQRDYDQSNPRACVAGMAKRLLRQEQPWNWRYWFPLATPKTLWKDFGIDPETAKDIYVSGWESRSGFRATRQLAATMLRRLANTGEFRWGVAGA